MIKDVRSDYPIRMDKFDHMLIGEMKETIDEWPKLEKNEVTARAMETWFSSLYKPKAMKIEELTGVGEKVKTLLEAAESTTEWKQFRESSILDELASATGAVALARVVETPDDEQPDDDELRKLRVSMRQAMKEAEEEVAAQREAEALIWGHEEGILEHTASTQERLQLAKDLKSNEHFKRLMDLVGRFKVIARKKYKERVKHGYDDIVDIETGNDLARVLPSELMYLCHPLLKKLFYLNYTNGSLLQYSVQGMEPKGKGPIVCCIDRSSSMREGLSGQNYYGVPPMSRMDWALGVVLALSYMVKEEKRDLIVIPFDTAVHPEIRVYENGVADLDAIRSLTGIGASGGTEFERPLTIATDLIERENNTKADILLVTDGYAHLSNPFITRFKERKDALKFQVYSVVIGIHKVGILDYISDEQIPVLNLAGANDAMDMIFTMGAR